jgi:hypothetical protein
VDNREAVIQKHFTELAALYPGLVLIESNYDTWVVQGMLEFSAIYDGVSIRDNFQMEFTLLKDYPDIPPIAKEIGGRIPKEFHKNPDGSLCLGAPLEVRMKFAQNPSLLGFVNELVIHFLYAYCYFEQHGEMPFGELSHGGKGILEYYAQLFNVASEIATVELLKILAENNYKGHHDCPCRSGKRIRDCHGGLLLNINSYQSQLEFLYDYIQCLTYLQKTGKELPESLFSQKVRNLIKNYSHELNNKEEKEIVLIK